MDHGECPIRVCTALHTSLSLSLKNMCHRASQSRMHATCCLNIKPVRIQENSWCYNFFTTHVDQFTYIVTLIVPQERVSPCATFTPARKYAFHIILQNQCSCKESKEMAQAYLTLIFLRYVTVHYKWRCNMFPKKLKAVGIQRNGTHRGPGNLFHSSKYSQGTDQPMDHSATLALCGVSRSEDQRKFHNIGLRIAKV